MEPGGSAATRARWIRRLALGIIAVSVGEFLIATIGVQIHRMPPRTDFATYYIAGQMAREKLSPYDWKTLIARGHGLGFTHEQYPFLYPPTFALVMQPFSKLPFVRARQIWMLVTTLALLGALAVTGILIRRQAAALGMAESSIVWADLAAIVPAALNSANVHSDVRLGSVGTILWLVLGFVALGLLEAAPRRAGIALAIASHVRATPFVFVPYLGYRLGRRAALACVGLAALALVPAVLHWGIWILIDWWRHGIALALHRETGWAINQSLAAYLVRLFDPHTLIEAPSKVSLAPRLLTAVFSIAIVGWTVRVMVVRTRPRVYWPLEFGCAVLALLVVTKISWVHTLAAMLFVWPVLMLVVLRAAERGAIWARRAGIAACAGFFFASAHLPVIWSERLYHGPWVALTGLHLIGVLVLWMTSCFVLRAVAIES